QTQDGAENNGCARSARAHARGSQLENPCGAEGAHEGDAHAEAGQACRFTRGSCAAGNPGRDHRARLLRRTPSRGNATSGCAFSGFSRGPTASAITHPWRGRRGDGNFLVYARGGGTFDVSILRCVGGEYQALAREGDNSRGGDVFDRRYAEHLRKELVEKG